MDIRGLQERAMALRTQYAALEVERHGRSWTREEVALGFVGDVGDLMKLVMAKEGVRAIPDTDEKLAHELADCLWVLLVLAQLYEVDIEQVFLHTMDDLETRIATRTAM